MKQKFYILKKGTQQGEAGECWLEMADCLGFHFASFKNLNQARKFFGIFQAKFSPVYADEFCEVWESDKLFNDGGYFWKKEELPAGAKKIKGLSNGAIVDCFYIIKKDNILFYRPNPNAKRVYRPLSVEEHIKFQSENGIY